MFLARALESSDRSEWEHFISGCAESTFFHTPDSVKLIESMGQTPLHWGLWLDGELAVVWPTQLLPGFGGKALRGRWAPAIRGDVDVTLLHHTVSYIIDATKKEAFHWSADIREDAPFLELACQCGFERSPSRICTYVVNATLGNDVLWTRLSKKARNAIRNAMRSGLYVKQPQDLEDLTTFLSVYHSTMERLHALDSSEDRFLTSTLSFLMRENKAKLFTVHEQERMVGGIILLLHKQDALWWIGGSTPDSWRKRPNELLLWNAIEWASKSGFRELDLGSSPIRRTHGLHLFKRHLGEQVNMIHLHLPLSELRDFLSDALVNVGVRLYESGVIPTPIRRLVLKRGWIE